MMNKKTAAQGFGAAFATPLAIGATAVAYKAWPQMHVLLIVMIFIGLWAGIFKMVVWFFTRELPVTGAERRRRNQHCNDRLRRKIRRKFKTAHYPDPPEPEHPAEDCRPP